MKTCKKCNESKPLEAFSKHSVTKDGLRSACRACCAAAYNVVDRKAYNIARRYGLSETDYLALIAPGCGVCGSNDDLHIDHDHSCCSGEKTCGQCVRGVLCRRHNMAEGLLHSSVDECMAMAAYLLQFTNVLQEGSVK